MDNNVYLLRCRQTDDQVLVDAADDRARILEVVGADGLRTVVTTHQHWDHHRALAEVVAATAATTVAGAEDADELPVTVDRRVGDGDVVEVGDCRLEVIRLTGHTPGSIALLYDDPDGTPHLFTGDSLFPGGRADDGPGRLHVADGRPGGEGVRPAPRRDLVLPRPRRGLDPGRAAPAPRGVALAGLVSPFPAPTASHFPILRTPWHRRP